MINIPYNSQLYLIWYDLHWIYFFCCEPNLSPVYFLHQRLVAQGFASFSIPNMNKLLNNQSYYLWFETSWCTCDGTVIIIISFRINTELNALFHNWISYLSLWLNRENAALQKNFSVIYFEISVCTTIISSVIFKPHRQTTNISRTLLGNGIVDHSYLVGAAPSSSFST